MSHIVNLDIVNKYLSENLFLFIKCDGDDVSTSYLNFTKFGARHNYLKSRFLKFPSLYNHLK